MFDVISAEAVSMWYDGQLLNMIDTFNSPMVSCDAIDETDGASGTKLILIYPISYVDGFD